MAGDADFESSATPSLQQLASFFADEMYSVDRLKRVENLHRNAHAEGAVIAEGARMQAGHDLGATLEDTFEDVKDKAQRAMGAMLGWLVGEIIGVEVSPTALFNSSRNPEDSAVGQAVAAVAFKAVTATTGEIQPGDEGAKRLLGMLAHIITHCWAEGIVLEKLEGYTSWSGHIEKIGELGKELVQSLGLTRAARMAIRPTVKATISTPAEWKANKQYRPTLLPAPQVIAAGLRGDYSGGEVAEELSRMGYSDRRQEMLLKSGYKGLSLDDSLVLVRYGVFGRDFAIANLRSQGYDQPTAEIALQAAETKRLQSIQDDSLAAVRSAYVDRRIGDGELSNFLSAIVVDEAERATHEVAMRTIRDVNTKRLSATQAEACVKASVLPMAAYRDALANEGYDPDAALALELLLETEINKGADVEALRKQKLDDAAAAKAAKAAADAAKQAAAEAQRVLARRGPLSELVRAAVRRLIPIARVTEVLAASYDADTVQIYVDDINDQIAAADAQQQKADDAKKRAAIRHIDVGAFEQAVLEDVLSIDQFRRQLDTLNFDPADAAVLTATLQQRKADLDAAKKKRAEADTAAKQKSIDLTRFEQLVRRGVRSLADYDALLRTLDFDDASRAAMVELLQLHIDDDVAAAKKRAELAAVDPAKGLSLDQYRRAVILQLKTIDDLQAWLIQQRYTTDAQVVIVAELRDDVAQADAARRKRETTAAGSGAPAIPLSTVARAARLGIVPPALYQQRLTDAGYTSDDIAIEMALLVTEIADVAAAKAKQDEKDAAAAAPTLTLAQLATAARADVLPIGAYQARAFELGYSADDVDTLVRVLQIAVDAAAASRARRAQLEAKQTPAGPSLAELRGQVLAGAMTLEAYVGRLTAAGLDPVDVDMLASLLADELAAG